MEDSSKIKLAISNENARLDLVRVMLGKKLDEIERFSIQRDTQYAQLCKERDSLEASLKSGEKYIKSLETQLSSIND